MKVKHIVVELTFWLRDGRTLVSVPFTFLLLLLIALQIMFIKATMRRVHAMEASFNHNERSRQPYTMETLSLWKDQWSD
jgi:TRAP-type C4-dicarboxylate transport system permease small subunit